MAKDDIKEQPNSRRRLDGNARVASAAAALDAAKIPHVLWGLYPLTIYGIPTVVNVCILRQFKLFNTNISSRASTSLLKMIN